MNYPVTVEEFLEAADSFGLEVNENVANFMSIIVNALNEAYYQGMADGRCGI